MRSESILKRLFFRSESSGSEREHTGYFFSERSGSRGENGEILETGRIKRKRIIV